jgi:hypothetical protein
MATKTLLASVVSALGFVGCVAPSPWLVGTRVAGPEIVSPVVTFPVPQDWQPPMQEPSVTADLAIRLPLMCGGVSPAREERSLTTTWRLVSVSENPPRFRTEAERYFANWINEPLSGSRPDVVFQFSADPPSAAQQGAAADRQGPESSGPR